VYAQVKSAVPILERAPRVYIECSGANALLFEERGRANEAFPILVAEDVERTLGT
jgi:hypothetical protein